MAHTRTMMQRGTWDPDLGRMRPAVVERRLEHGKVKCKRCGTARAPFQHCRTCEIAKGRRVGRVDRVEAVTPTERKERATL